MGEASGAGEGGLSYLDGIQIPFNIDYNALVQWHRSQLNNNMVSEQKMSLYTYLVQIHLGPISVA